MVINIMRHESMGYDENGEGEEYYGVVRFGWDVMLDPSGQFYAAGIRVYFIDEVYYTGPIQGWFDSRNPIKRLVYRIITPIHEYYEQRIEREVEAYRSSVQGHNEIHWLKRWLRD